VDHHKSGLLKDRERSIQTLSIELSVTERCWFVIRQSIVNASSGADLTVGHCTMDLVDPR